MSFLISIFISVLISEAILYSILYKKINFETELYRQICIFWKLLLNKIPTDKQTLPNIIIAEVFIFTGSSHNFRLVYTIKLVMV